MDEEVASSLQHSSSAEESMECEHEGSPIHWSNLPSPALETIYSFVSRKDQSSMSQVCKNWSIEYNSPSLWRKITFNLSEHALTTDMHPVVRSAQRFGQYLHHIEVVVWDPIASRNGDKEDLIGKQLKLFLQILANKSQLLSFSFKYIPVVVFRDVSQSLLDLLVTQNKLQSVAFHCTSSEKRLAMDIIQTVFSKNSRTLKNLYLGNFINRFSGHTTIDVPLTFETLINLKTLTIEYSYYFDYIYYFEDIITSIYEHRSELRSRGRVNLEAIRLSYFQIGIFPFDGIQPAAWSHFRNIFPALKLSFRLNVWGQTELACISRHMPVSRLDITWPESFTEHSELGTILSHLTACEINNDLEILIVRVENADSLFEDIMNFLLVSPKLKELRLHFSSLVNSLNELLEYWLESGPRSLEIVHIFLSKIPDGELTSNYKNLANYYAPLLKDLGLILKLFIYD